LLSPRQLLTLRNACYRRDIEVTWLARSVWAVRQSRDRRAAEGRARFELEAYEASDQGCA
jgi:hypothetical protein